MIQSLHPEHTALCRLDELAEPGSKGFTFGAGGARREIFVVRDAGGVHGYENVCPHKDMILDGVANQFLTLDKQHILCINHGARFRIHDGVCVHGPCKGKRLTPLTIEIVDGQVVLAAATDRRA
jgi:nitrite reductase/ring-hydroxylating ferredoxin subunit